jgi:Ca2+:H+ antiporter
MAVRPAGIGNDARVKPLLWLLPFIPVTAGLEWIGAASPLVFLSAAMAIIPLAALMAHSTEQLAAHTGDTIGGLLNATFGNAPELIIAVVALHAGLLEIVKASLVGAILTNLLLGLGLSFLLGGLRHHSQEFNPSGTRIHHTMMLIAVISMAIPGAFHRAVTDAAVRYEDHVNIGVAVVLLVTYLLMLVFMLRTHPEVFASRQTPQAEFREGERAWNVSQAVVGLLFASGLVAWMSDLLLGVAEETGRTLGMSDAFIGLVLLSGVGGAAELSAAVVMARKDRMDMSIGIVMGSSIQIALFVAPLLVLVSYWIASRPLDLIFGRLLMTALFLAVLIGVMAAGDGKSNWYKGVQLLIVYLLFALLFYFLPTVA